MRNWIRSIAFSALGALLAASSGQVLAAGECVTIAHDVASGEKLNLDPARNVVLDGAGLIVSIYDALVDFDSNFQLVPRLATSWESNADATEWTIKLREGVKFHDGTDFDAADVVYTYRRVLDPDLGSPGRALLAFVEPEGIEAVDAHTVRFTTKNPTPQLPTQLKSRFVHIVPEGATAQDMENHGVGTGPFILGKDFDKGAPFWKVARNPNYWQPGMPKAECIRFTSILEPITRAAALISGEIDIASAIDPVLVPLLENNEDVNVVKAAGGASIALSMWVDTPPFDDVRVRQALKAVVDRQAIVDGALLGLGEPGADSPIPPSSAFAYPASPPERNVAKAKQLLADAGYPDGARGAAPRRAGRGRVHERRPGLRADGGRCRHQGQAQPGAGRHLLERDLAQSTILGLGLEPAAAVGGAVGGLSQGSQVERDALVPRRLRRVARPGRCHARRRGAGRAVEAGAEDAGRGGRNRDHCFLSQHCGGAGRLRRLHAAPDPLLLRFPRSFV